MSQRNIFTRAQRTVLLRGLIEMADDNNHIPLNVSAISAKLEERMGRTISDMTTRTYLKDSGFTWETCMHNGGGRGRQSSRARELAAVVFRVMQLCGIEDQELIDKVRNLASHKPLDLHS